MEQTRNGTSRSRSRSGSFFADKQIAYAVRDGVAVEVTLVGGQSVIGWVFGTDNYHWGLVSRMGEVSLIHKSAPCLKITEHKLSREPQDVQDVVNDLVGPFRDYVMREHFGKTAVPATS